jgi:hypothetical protein
VLAFDYGLRRGVHKTSLKFVLGSNLQQDRTQRSGGGTGGPFAAPFRQHAPIIPRQHRASPSSNTLQRIAKLGHATDRARTFVGAAPGEGNYAQVEKRSRASVVGTELAKPALRPKGSYLYQ